MNRLIRGLKDGGVYPIEEDTSEFPTKTHAGQNQLKGPDGLWGFLRDKRNQQVLGWLGGGLVVVATGLWAAFVYFFPLGKSPEAKSPEPVSVQADHGGIAIGRDVTGSTITTGGTTNSDRLAKPK
jgi:hypothetical protein